jgi:hypothetical protein
MNGGVGNVAEIEISFRVPSRSFGKREAFVNRFNFSNGFDAMQRRFLCGQGGSQKRDKP